MEPATKQHRENGVPSSEGPASRQSPKVERITRQARGLVEDVKEWVDLRVQLVQLEIEERIEAKVNQVVLGGVLAVILLLAGVFGLTALALAMGSWLGNDAWGFLIVAALLVLLAAGLWAAKPRVLKKTPSPLPENKRLEATQTRALPPTKT